MERQKWRWRDTDRGPWETWAERRRETEKERCGQCGIGRQRRQERDTCRTDGDRGRDGDSETRTEHRVQTRDRVGERTRL